jgi:ribosomal protein S18 acetylase RimI-like enzyme
MTAQYDIRPVHAHEWAEIKALRLRALSDEAASIAFLDSYAEASTRPDEFWQDRARGSAVEAGPGAGARQFVAVTAEGDWVGTAVGLVEKAGDVDFEGALMTRTGGHVVGVFLCPGHRGTGVLGRLFQAVTDWLREAGLDHVRLYVHADNVRAQRSYEKLGFTRTGTQVSGSIGTEIEMARPL